MHRVLGAGCACTVFVAIAMGGASLVQAQEVNGTQEMPGPFGAALSGEQLSDHRGGSGIEICNEGESCAGSELNQRVINIFRAKNGEGGDMSFVHVDGKFSSTIINSGNNAALQANTTVAITVHQ